MQHNGYAVELCTVNHRDRYKSALGKYHIGLELAHDPRRLADAAQLAKLEKEMQGPELVVTVDLHLGTFAASIYTCDLSLDYVHINADYTT